MSQAFIGQLESIIRDRIDNPVDGSYTTSLVEAGTQRVAQKVGEEAVELALAAVAGDAEEVVSEAADLVYHLLVLIQHQGLSLDDIGRELKRRHP